MLFGAAGRIETAEACPNVAPEPARAFEIAPAALFAAYRAARAGGPRPIGHYHSHPSGEAVPSARDAAQAMGDGALWLILTAREARLWVSARPGAFEPVALAVEDD
ncbi:MAG: peptidase [Sphingomonas bacterium]|nr:peptidase [Sphingomonas bacterium]